MKSLAGLLLVSAFALAACQSAPVELGPDGRPLPQLYRIAPNAQADVTYRVLDQVNTLRQAAGATPLELNAELTAAAATHARDMSVQNRPWHFGSDGSSPLDRAQRAGYQGRVLGETISETFETESETLSAWMGVEDTRNVILHQDARNLGFSWYQEPSGKIWWTLLTGT